MPNYQSYNSHPPVKGVPPTQRAQKAGHSRARRGITWTGNFIWLALRGFGIGLCFGAGGIAAVALALFLSYQYVHHVVAPDIDKFVNQRPPESTKLYAADGTLLYEIFDPVKRTVVPLEKISPTLREATLVAEDRDFYQHPGVSLPGIVRAAVLDYYIKDLNVGGSTITQQLIKNAILTPEKSVTRKLAEITWAVELERKMSKEQILAAYLNFIPYGRNSAGVEAAAESYFGKPASNLSLVESVYLAAMPQAPSLLSPTGANRTYLDDRAAYILQGMLDQQYITQAEFNDAKNTAVAFKTPSNVIPAPHFVLWVKQQLISQFGAEKVNRGGLLVQTSLDTRLQNIAETVVTDGVKKNAKLYYGNNAALVAIDPKRNAVLAMVGGKDYYGAPVPKGCLVGKTCTFDPNTNVATSLRQVGSSFKPYVYLTAFGEDFGFTPSSFVYDVSKNFSAPGALAYVPHNYNGAQYGRVPIRKALGGSLNIAAVNTLSQIGVKPVVENLRKLGVTAPLENCGLALALGSCEMSLLEHTSGFSTIANMGLYHALTGVDKIIDGTGKTVWEPGQAHQVVNPQAAYELIDIMTDNEARAFIFGADTPLHFTDRKAGVKTGTTQNWKDGWTVGFTPQLAAGVWAGNNNGELLRAGSDGVFVAAPIWRAFMDKALAKVPAVDFPEPYGITRAAVNPATGQVVKTGTRGSKVEVFASYALPIDTSKLAAPKKTTPKPQVAGVEISHDPEATQIVDPLNGKAILQTPFDVKVYTGSSTVATEVSLSIDGKVVATKSEAPFLFTITQMLSNGTHTISATATHYGLLQSTDTVKVKTLYNPPPAKPREAATSENSKPLPTFNPIVRGNQ